MISLAAFDIKIKWKFNTIQNTTFQFGNLRTSKQMQFGKRGTKNYHYYYTKTHSFKKKGIYFTTGLIFNFHQTFIFFFFVFFLDIYILLLICISISIYIFRNISQKELTSFQTNKRIGNFYNKRTYLKSIWIEFVKTNV